MSLPVVFALALLAGPSTYTGGGSPPPRPAKLVGAPPPAGGLVPAGTREIAGAKAAGKYVVVEPGRGPSTRVFNRSRDQIEIVKTPGASRRQLEQLAKSADAIAVKSPALAPRTHAAVFVDGDRLTPPEKLGAGAMPRNRGLVRNPRLVTIGKIENAGGFVRFRDAQGQLLARVKATEVPSADLVGQVPVRILTTGKPHFVSPELVKEAETGWQKLQAQMAAAKREHPDTVFVYASTFLSGGKPEEGALNRDIGRFVSDEVLTRHARSLLGTDHVFVINPARAEANLPSARSGDDYMWFWSEFLLGGKGGQDIDVYHFTGPRMVRAYFDAYHMPIPEPLRDRGLENSVGMRQEWNAAVLRNAKNGVNGHMAHIFYDGAPVPMAAHQYIKVPEFNQVGWNKRDKNEPLPPRPAADPQAWDRLSAEIDRERFGGRIDMTPVDERKAVLGRAKSFAGVDPAFALNVERAHRIGGEAAATALHQAAEHELAAREKSIHDALAAGRPVDAMDLYRARMLAGVHGLGAPEADAFFKTPGAKAQMALRSGVTWTESDPALVRSMVDQVAGLQRSLDDAARAGKQRLYLSGPISSDDSAKNLDLLARATKRLQQPNLYIVNPGEYQELLPHSASGNHFMWVWERVLGANDGGNFEHVDFLGDAWTQKLYRESTGKARVGDPRYVAKGVMESAGSRFEWMDVRAANQARARAGKPAIHIYEDGRELTPATTNAKVQLTTYEKRAEGAP